jgi:flagellar protein FlbD
MIALTRLNHVPLVLNSDLIEQVEVTPDTVITLTTGEKIMVLESAEEVVNRVTEFRRSISGWAAGCPLSGRTDAKRNQQQDGRDAKGNG